MMRIQVYGFSFFSWGKIGVIVGFFNAVFYLLIGILFSLIHSVNAILNIKVGVMIFGTAILTPVIYCLLYPFLKISVKVFGRLIIVVDTGDEDYQDEILGSVKIRKIQAGTLDRIAYRVIPLSISAGLLYLAVLLIVNFPVFVYDLRHSLGVLILFISVFCFPLFWARPFINWALEKSGGHVITGKFSIDSQEPR